jgi:RNA polymerase sigma-70 factor (ECF subfamily)
MSKLLERGQSNRLVASTQPNATYLTDPDVQLMLRVKGGDEAAFAKLVAIYQDRLISIFANLVDDQEQAEDLTQELFLRIYRARHGYEPNAKFSTWVFRIANNLASNSRRSRGRRKEVQLKTSESGPLGVRPAEKLLADKSALMPTRLLDKSEMRRIVLEALDSLNDRQRLALLLHKFEDMSYADIGDAMEMSPQAVKSLLSRARENLRVKLEPHVR